MSISNFPQSGYVRIWQIIGDKKRKIPPVLPVSRSTWLAGVKSGKYPKPIRMAPRCLAWRAEDIQALIDSFTA